MTTRRAAWIGVAVTAALLAAAAGWRLSARPVRIDRSVFDQIQIGMTEREVSDLLGVPPGYYGTRAPVTRWVVAEETVPEGAAFAPDSSDCWSSDNASIFVRFGPDATVESKTFATHPGPPLSPLDRLMQWLGL